MAPLVVTAMLAMTEIGYTFMLRQTVTLAAREGARAGALPGAAMSDIQAAVDASMSAANLTPATAPGNPSDPNFADTLDGYVTTSNIDQLGPTDTNLEVTVTMPIDRTLFTGTLLGGGNFTVSATSSMRREGIE